MKFPGVLGGEGSFDNRDRTFLTFDKICFCARDVTIEALGLSRTIVKAIRQPSHSARRNEYAEAMSEAKVSALARVRMLKWGLWFDPSAISLLSASRLTDV